ncbi:MAG TPA: hypothetical protein VGK17_21445 [Propionicimonas sp.]|jgi:hypothetical protein
MAGVEGAGHRDPVLWAHWGRKIEDDRAENNQYSCATISAAAARFDRNERTIRRWLKEDPHSRDRFELEDEHLAYIKLTGGFVGEAWKLALADGKVGVSEKTFRRAFRRLPNAVQEGLRHGKDRCKAALPWLTLPEPTRPGQVYEIDHALLADILIRDAHTQHRGHPWLTLVTDVYSRMIVGFAVTLADRKDNGSRGTAKTESAFAALADALLGRDYDGVFVGGKPETVRFDQGKDFMHPVADALDRLGIGQEPVEAETPQHKPHVERAIGTFKRTLLPPLPGWGMTMKEAA